MGRIVAIDYGKKRTGLAVTDPLQCIATALTTIDTVSLMSFLRPYIDQEQVEEVVVGMPYTLQGKPTDVTHGVEQLIRMLQKKFPKIHIAEIDEWFTSKIARRAMVEGGMKKKKRREKGQVDQISAVLILQSYLLSKDHAEQISPQS